jgi:uncharacterized protein YcbX
MIDPRGSRLIGIFRHPVKGLNAESLEAVNLEADQGLPHDRRFALARAGTAFDPVHPVWLRKSHFLMLMRDEALAAVEVDYRHERRRLTVRRDGRTVVEADLDSVGGREEVERFFARHLGLPDPPRLVESDGHMFSDDPEKLVSLINLGTVRELATVLGTPVAPARFRGNLLIDGAAAWEEFGWVGQRLQIGGAGFEVVKRIDRCAATNVDPVTAKRDLNIPGTLRRHYDHIDCGVFLRVTGPGEIRIGEGVRMEDR